jgi:hypothetical protein
MAQIEDVINKWGFLKIKNLLIILLAEKYQPFLL